MTETQQLPTPAELAEYLAANPAALPELVAPLGPGEAAALVDHLKAEADRHWWINANQSLVFAGLIIAIGQARGDTWQVALGTMARGDALKFVGNAEEAWQLLGGAGELFLSIGDAVGWARTRIGRLLISVELARVGEALADAEQARAIFQQHGESERLLGLTNNAAIVQAKIGDYRRALELYSDAMDVAASIGERGQASVTLLLIGIGYAHDMLGNFRQAADAYQRAHQSFAERGQKRGMALAEHNLGYIALCQGQHRRALKLLHHARDLYTAEQLSLDATHVSRDMIDGYMQLNRYAEARDLARAVADTYHAHDSMYQQAQALLLLATAEARLGQFAAAESALDSAEAIFGSLGAGLWRAMAQLRRGQIALKTADFARACVLAGRAAAVFQANGKQLQYAEGLIAGGQASFSLGDQAGASGQATAALRAARACNAPALRYSAHLLLGTIAEAQDRPARAARHYTAAMALIDRVQRGLTITLRPGFLEDKTEALHRLLRLQLGRGQARLAFEALERAKSQTLLGQLANREQLRWASGDHECQLLIERLGRLREEHQWFTRLAHAAPIDSDQPHSAVRPEQALAEVARCEREMRLVTERLYLQSGGDWVGGITAPRLADVQGCLAAGTLLIEWYADGNDLWAFTVDAARIDVTRIPGIMPQLEQLLAQLQANVDFALKAGSAGPAARGLAAVARRILQRLYGLLLAPLAHTLGGYARLLIAPYGPLHYLPFQLLHDGSRYLIESYEVVLLPAAGLITRPAPRQQPGATILAHSWNGQLTQTQAEAELVRQLAGGTIAGEQDARRSVLERAPTQILHIAAHGQHRIDQPDLSYIELADGQLYTDDLLQHDLSYELVVLSACETGRAHVSAGDELIGLGRGFLYAGAGALITSLWRVADDATLHLMHGLYTALCKGESKAAALRRAQRERLAEQPDQHPAFWGAFQLVGNARPLSKDSSERNINVRTSSVRPI